MEKEYNPKDVEEKIYELWESNGFFVGNPSSKERFSMVLPPPNITGSLHMGHALPYTLPDIVARRARMMGKNVMWLPGIDHAGIATQMVVERELLSKGIDRKAIGREKFVEEVWKWKEKCREIIVKQLKRLGCSLDWTRERFTMDEGLSRAVRKVFVSLFKEGLIYRGFYLVNWCPRCETALSDLEVIHKEVSAHLYYIKYPIKDENSYIVVATTRPETMLGDTAVAVNPEDERYKAFIGKIAILPILGREIEIISDEVVEKDFGTGAVKVTPAHDPTDFMIAQRHNLPYISIFDTRGRLNSNAGEEFKGIDRFEARKKVIERLKGLSLLEKIDNYNYAVGHCQRCGTVIEPYLSWQWFVKMKPLAKDGIRVVKEKKVEFIPSFWEKTYMEWMENIHDWCISRQIWWGHRIPVWYCLECNETISEMESPEKCPKCGSKKLKEEEDVLDTWFSSALWPFSTLGWPENTEDLKAFYPTDLMITGFDIIFFWVARMIMMGMKFIGKPPFRKVFINGLIRDEHGQKMSKSRGNVIDFMEVIERYGADSLRFTLASLALPGVDISLSEKRIAGYKAFANKVWNASRFVLLNYKGEKLRIKEDELTLSDRWIRSRLHRNIKEVNEALDEFRFYEASEKIYHFIWDEFCDWYIEFVKEDLRKGNVSSLSNLLYTLDSSLRLLHPFMPFITEEIWQKLPHVSGSITISPFPQSIPEYIDETAEEEIEIIMDFVKTIRKVRAENLFPPSSFVDVSAKILNGRAKAIIENVSYIKNLARVKELLFVEELPPSQESLKASSGNFDIVITSIPPKKVLEDKKKKELEKIEKEISAIRHRISNPGFMEKAPEDVKEKLRSRLKELEELREKLLDGRKTLNQ
ncbi:MAG: valine--tRNA ligase [Candidatus Aminicenantia bacterium]